MTSLPSKEYWQKRAEQTLLANEKSILEYEEELRRAYEQAINRVEKEINSFFAKYAKDNNIDLATARQRLNTDELKSFKQQEKLYFDEATRLGLDPQYRKYLRNLSAKSYISKLEEITANIRHEIEKLSKEAEKGLELRLKEGYEDSYYKPLYDIDRTIGLGADFTAVGKRTVDKAIRSVWLEDNFSGRIWKNKTALITQLNQMLPQEFVRSRNPKEVAKDLARRLNANYKNAVRLARTEMNHISNQATMDAYKDSGVLEKYEYLATLDSRTSDICREMDGKVFPLSQAQTGVNLPPLHPYCRSTTIPWFPEEEMEGYDEQRIAKDKDGNYYLVDKVNYEQWAREHADDAYATRITGRSGWEHLQYTRYRAVLGNMVPGSYSEFVSLKAQDPEKWKYLKSKYRAINRYENPDGVDPELVIKLHNANVGTRYNLLHNKGDTVDLRTVGNTATMEFNGNIYFSHSSVTKAEKDLYNRYNGRYEFVDIPKEGTAKFSWHPISKNDKIPRFYDTEYRFFEFAASKLKPDDSGTITILSQKHICSSCQDVRLQFEKAFPNVKVRVVSGKYGYRNDPRGNSTYVDYDEYGEWKKDEEVKKNS